MLVSTVNHAILYSKTGGSHVSKYSKRPCNPFKLRKYPASQPLPFLGRTVRSTEPGRSTATPKTGHHRLRIQPNPEPVPVRNCKLKTAGHQPCPNNLERLCPAGRSSLAATSFYPTSFLYFPAHPLQKRRCLPRSHLHRHPIPVRAY